MTGNQAYANYYAAEKDCTRANIPRFTSTTECILHAEQICREKTVMTNYNALEKFLLEIDTTE